MFNEEYREEYEKALIKLNEASRTATAEFKPKPLTEGVHMITDAEAKLIQDEHLAQKNYHKASDKYFGRPSEGQSN